LTYRLHLQIVARAQYCGKPWRDAFELTYTDQAGTTKFGFVRAVAVVAACDSGGVALRPKVFGRWLDGIGGPAPAGADPHLSQNAPGIAHLKYVSAGQGQFSHDFFDLDNITRPVWLCAEPQMPATAGEFYASTALAQHADFGSSYGAACAATGGREQVSEI
jgi:hypothetical protein